MKVEMQYKYNNNSLKLTAGSDSDRLLIPVIAKLVEGLRFLTEVSEQRVGSAQRKMHEATTALAEKEELKKTLLVRVASWMDKVLAKLKGAK